ncbi:MAG: carbonate dehydratase [Gammaproteobacteria bacterium]|jgi:carbonic anhydrase|nr:carbonate dehydratase [Gammaproteobacteria bacterium]
MSKLPNLFKNNREWAASVNAIDPGFFEKLSSQQAPEYLWIGCSDSRVPANQIVGLLPGEVFVHRNVANMVVHSDFNCLSVLQYAVEVLQVKHVLVVGHYDCGGVRAAYHNSDNGMIDNWLRNIKDVQFTHRAELMGLATDQQRIDRLVELNVRSQVAHVCQTAIVQKAWGRGQSLTVHGWVYSLLDGLLKDLECTVDSQEGLEPEYRIDC